MHNPKLKFLGCDNSTPLNMNLVPRFEETRKKDKADHQGCFETFDDIWFRGYVLIKVDENIKDWFSRLIRDLWHEIKGLKISTGGKERSRKVKKIDKGWSRVFTLSCLKSKSEEQQEII